MTLYDQLIMDRYKDVVHVDQAGAGLPDHDGEHAKIFCDDGSGGVDQILARLAVQHHLNPDPAAAAFSETKEFSTASALSGWTDDTGIVSTLRDGRIVLDYTPDEDQQVIGAYQSVNLTGDFDFITLSHGFGLMEVGSYVNKFLGNCIMVADSANNKCSGVAGALTGTRTRAYHWVDQTYPVAEALSYDNENMYHDAGHMVLRVCRYSGTIVVAVGNVYSPGSNDAGSVLGPPEFEYGWFDLDSVADANTYDRLYLGIFFQSAAQAVVSGRAQFPFIRRYK